MTFNTQRWVSFLLISRFPSIIEQDLCWPSMVGEMWPNSVRTTYRGSSGGDPLQNLHWSPNIYSQAIAVMLVIWTEPQRFSLYKKKVLHFAYFCPLAHYWLNSDHVQQHNKSCSKVTHQLLLIKQRAGHNRKCSFSALWMSQSPQGLLWKVCPVCKFSRFVGSGWKNTAQFLIWNEPLNNKNHFMRFICYRPSCVKLGRERSAPEGHGRRW